MDSKTIKYSDEKTYTFEFVRSENGETWFVGRQVVIALTDMTNNINRVLEKSNFSNRKCLKDLIKSSRPFTTMINLKGVEECIKYSKTSNAKAEWVWKQISMIFNNEIIDNEIEDPNWLTIKKNVDNQTVNFVMFLGDPKQIWMLAKPIADYLQFYETNYLRSLISVENIKPLFALNCSKKSNSLMESQSLFINEKGLYELITKSIKPKAKQLQAWVNNEILPRLRKSGCFEELSPLNDVFSDNRLVAKRQRFEPEIVIPDNLDDSEIGILLNELRNKIKEKDNMLAIFKENENELIQKFNEKEDEHKTLIVKCNEKEDELNQLTVYFDQQMIEKNHFIAKYNEEISRYNEIQAKFGKFLDSYAINVPANEDLRHIFAVYCLSKQTWTNIVEFHYYAIRIQLINYPTACSRFIDDEHNYAPHINYIQDLIWFERENPNAINKFNVIKTHARQLCNHTFRLRGNNMFTTINPEEMVEIIKNICKTDNYKI